MRIQHITPPHPLVKSTVSLIPHPLFQRLPLILRLPFLPKRTSLSLNRVFRYDTALEIVLH
jgi:hypothetical protein